MNDDSPIVFTGPYQPEPAFTVNGEGFDLALCRHFREAGRPLPESLRPKVSIVIAARNYGTFLGEAIESALAQTVPCEVLYCDDASLDDSLEVARRYERQGLVILRSSVHRGVVHARNKGFHAASGEWLINLDGDDVLPCDYVEQMLSVAKPGVPFCYGAAQAFGELDILWKAPPWPPGRLWLRNFVNTSAMYAKWAFHAAGGWRDDVGTMWDWSLALRAARFGKPQLAPAVLRYRIHSDSVSHALEEREGPRVEELARRMRRQLARLSVGSILSGRIPFLFPEWLDRLALSVRQMQLAEKPDLLLIDNSASAPFREIVERECQRHEETFEAIRILPGEGIQPWERAPQRGHQVAALLARCSNILKREMRGDLHWIVEDDILVPSLAGEKLLASLTAGLEPPEAVSAAYRNRHAPERMVGGWWHGGQPCEPAEPSGQIERVDFCGMGCVMYWAARVPEWGSHWMGVPAHDWAWGMEIKRRGGKVLLRSDVVCGHAASERVVFR